MKSSSMSIWVKAPEQYFLVVLFIVLYKVVLTFKSVDEIFKYVYFNESNSAILSCGTVPFQYFKWAF